MAFLRRTGGGGLSPPPPPRPSGRGLDLAVLVEDPRLYALDRLRRAVDRPQVVEVPPLGTGAERPRGERHVDLALGAPPQAKADEPRPRERTFLEVDLGLGHETLGT